MDSKLYVYGDSFVHGDTIPQDLTWPNRLGKELGYETINRGVAGGSNKLSVINLLDDMVTLENVKNTVVIFAWTSIHRTCINLDNYSTDWHNLLVTYRNKGKKLNQIEEAYFKFIHTDFDGLYNIYMQKILVQSFLKQIDVKYYFVNSFIDYYYTNTDFLEKPNLLEKFIEKDKYLLGYNNSIRNEICFKQGLTAMDGYHPNEEGHFLTMQLIKNDIKNKKLI